MRILFSLALFVGSAAYTLYGWQTLTFLTSTGRPGSGFFPILVGFGLVLGTAVNVIKDIRDLRAHRPDQVDEEHPYHVLPDMPHAPAAAVTHHVRDTMFVAASVVLLVGVLNVLGALLAMIAFMLLLLNVLNRGQWLTNAVYSVALPVGLYLLFSTLLNASLPRGVFGL